MSVFVCVFFVCTNINVLPENSGHTWLIIIHKISLGRRVCVSLVSCCHTSIYLACLFMRVIEVGGGGGGEIQVKFLTQCIPDLILDDVIIEVCS